MKMAQSTRSKPTYRQWSKNSATIQHCTKHKWARKCNVQFRSAQRGLSSWRSIQVGKSRARRRTRKTNTCSSFCGPHNCLSTCNALQICQCTFHTRGSAHWKQLLLIYSRDISALNQFFIEGYPTQVFFWFHSHHHLHLQLLNLSLDSLASNSKSYGRRKSTWENTSKSRSWSNTHQEWVQSQKLDSKK